jgi:hypothetical protein
MRSDMGDNGSVSDLVESVPTDGPTRGGSYTSMYGGFAAIAAALAILYAASLTGCELPHGPVHLSNPLGPAVVGKDFLEPKPNQPKFIDHY